MASRWPSRLLTAACACVVAAVVCERVRTFVVAPPTDFDDAYMFLRYADNLVAGHGLSWNPGDPVNGVTGLLHLGLVTLLRWARPAWDGASVLRCVSAGAGLSAVFALALTCARFSPSPRLRGRPLLLSALLLPLLAYSESFEFHAESGMDTMSSLLANVGLLAATLSLCERPTLRRALLCAVAGYLAFFARPDNALYALMLPLFAITLVCPPPRRALVVGFLPLFLLLVGGDLVTRRALLGTALPLGFYAKRPFAYAGFVGEYTWNPYLFLEVFARAAAPFLIVLGLFAERRHARRLAMLLAPLCATFAVLFGMNQIMGHLGRFFFPSLALLVVGAALVLDELRLRWQLALRFGVTLLVLAAGQPALEAAGRVYESRAQRQPLARLDGYAIDAPEPLPALDSWQSSFEVARIAAAAPPRTRLAMTEHGWVGAAAPHAILLDLVGLHDREVALHGFSAGALFKQEPDLIWMPHWDYTQMIRDLLDSDELWAHYDFYPDAFTYGVAIRKSGPHAAALRRLFDERFRAVYPGLVEGRYLAHRARSGPLVADASGAIPSSSGSGKCAADSDCRLQAFYCNECACLALPAKDPDPVCKGTPVQCFVNPCAGKSVQCRAKKCIVRDAASQ